MSIQTRWMKVWTLKMMTITTKKVKNVRVYSGDYCRTKSGAHYFWSRRRGLFCQYFTKYIYQIQQQKEGLIYLHQVIRDDAHVLYGFADKSERDLFRSLISVNGVGSSTAIMMLSSLSPDEIAVAVTTENVAALKAVKGIGIKTAQRIIIDLKDKLGKLYETDQIFLSSNNTILNESLSALVMLGFVKRTLRKLYRRYFRSNRNRPLKAW